MVHPKKEIFENKKRDFIYRGFPELNEYKTSFRGKKGNVEIVGSIVSSVRLYIV